MAGAWTQMAVAGWVSAHQPGQNISECNPWLEHLGAASGHHLYFCGVHSPADATLLLDVLWRRPLQALGY